jgi:hypothetical protein
VPYGKKSERERGVLRVILCFLISKFLYPLLKFKDKK